MTDFPVYRPIEKDLAQVELFLQDYLANSVPVMQETAVYLLNAGGKRLRPAFALLAGHFHNYSLQRLLPLAAVLELIHMATLIHDDIIDASATRRGMPTINALWGDMVSRQTGDYLFAKSLLLIDRIDLPEVARVLAEVSVQMVQGELQQLVTTRQLDQQPRDYFHKIRRKTALLIAASFQLGALVCGADRRIVNALEGYGYHLGMSFQITDDVLDLVADPGQLGKPVGGDLRQGILTLPLILALRDSPARAELGYLLSRQSLTEEEVSDCIALITRAGCIEQAMAVSQRYLQRAYWFLQDLPDLPCKHVLYNLGQSIQIRTA